MPYTWTWPTEPYAVHVPTVSGAALIAAYARAKAMTPNGAAVSLSNPVSVILQPGAIYDLAALTSTDSTAAARAVIAAAFDTPGVRIVSDPANPATILQALEAGTTLVPQLASACGNVRLSARDSGGDPLTPLWVPPTWDAQAIGDRQLRGPAGYTTLYALKGSDFVGFGAVASTPDDPSYPTGSTTFSENSDNYTTARHDLGAAGVDLTGCLFDLDLTAHPTDLATVTRIQFHAIDTESRTTKWSAWLPLSSFRATADGRYSVSMSWAQYVSQTAEFDMTHVRYLAVEMYMPDSGPLPSFTLHGCRVVTPPAAAPAYVSLQFDDCRTTSIAAIEYAVSKGIKVSVFAFTRSLNGALGYETYYRWPDLDRLASMPGVKVFSHTVDHDTDAWEATPELMAYDVAAAKKEFADHGYPDAWRVLATPGGKFPVGTPLGGLAEAVRVTYKPKEDGDGQVGTVLDATWQSVSATYVGEGEQANDQLTAIVNGGTPHGGALSTVLIHGLDVAEHPNTTANFEAYIDALAAAVAAGDVVTLHCDDLLEGNL